MSVPDQPKEALEGAESTVIHQTTELPVKHEDRTLVNCREINDWRDQCARFQMPVFTEDNWAGAFLGLGVGLIASAISGAKHGTSLALGGSMFLVVAFALGSIAYSKRRKERHDLSLLAEVMAGARDANRVIQKQTSGSAAT